MQVDLKREMFFSSVRYIPTQLIVIPHEGEFLIGKSYGMTRDLIAALPPEELPAYFTSEWNKVWRAHQQEQLRLRHERQTHDISSNIDNILKGL